MYKVYYELQGHGNKVAFVCSTSESDAKSVLENQYFVGKVKVIHVDKCSLGEVVFVGGRW
jgi:hypothetical protein